MGNTRKDIPIPAKAASRGRNDPNSKRAAKRRATEHDTFDSNSTPLGPRKGGGGGWGAEDSMEVHGLDCDVDEGLLVPWAKNVQVCVCV